MTKKERARLAVNALKNEYPDAICSLRAEETLTATDRHAPFRPMHGCAREPCDTGSV